MKHMKKMICVLISLTIILLCAGVTSAGAAVDEAAATAADAAAVFYLGDADLDGEIAITDATYIQRALAGYNELSFKSENLGDANRNDCVDILDATLIQRHLAGYSTPTNVGKEMPARTMTFSTGYAQPFVKINEVSESYRNKGSDVIRFVVFVETDYDTDIDGKPDLVKAWVQVPRSAAEGDYGAPVLFEANPYSTNANQITFPTVEEGIAEENFRTTPDKRVPSGTKSTMQLAADFRYRDIKDYSIGDINKYNYFLARGFAIVGSAGLGTRGSEGLELCGTQMEADAFKCIVEWIHGDRKAYSNLTDNLEVTADWTNGKTGMLGVSYMGTTAYEVAATGVEGLEAIVPTAGISSWYDYINQQGAPVYGFYHYCAGLSAGCASRFFDGIDDEQAYQNYLGWRKYVSDAEKALKANYGDIWDVRDFSQSNNIKAAALIVEGLSDDNVRPKQFKLMMDAFERNGAPVSALLHQGGHATLGSSFSTMKIGSYENFLWLVNRFFSYYLTGYENGIDRLPKYIVQSNIDGKFYTYDEWESGESFNIDLTADEAEVKIARNGIRWWGDYMEEDTTIKGVVEVHLRMKADNLNFDKAAVEVSLVDLYTSGFRVYCGDNMYVSTVARTALYDGTDGRYIPIDQYAAKSETQVFFTHGMVDLGTPDAGWLPQSAVAPETPVQAGEWHDYVIYLEPEVYTVRKGHTLFVGVAPKLENFNGQYDSVGSIYLDPSACYVVLPTDQASTTPYVK